MTRAERDMVCRQNIPLVIAWLYQNQWSPGSSTSLAWWRSVRWPNMAFHFASPGIQRQPTMGYFCVRDYRRFGTRVLHWTNVGSVRLSDPCLFNDGKLRVRVLRGPLSKRLSR